MITKFLFNTAVKIAAVAVLAIVLNASIDDFVLGLLGGWFIIFLWSRRP